MLSIDKRLLKIAGYVITLVANAASGEEIFLNIHLWVFLVFDIVSKERETQAAVVWRALEIVRIRH